MLRQQSLLSELVRSLEKINSSHYPDLPEIIKTLKKIDEKADPLDEDLTASCIINILALYPDLMKDPNNKQLEELCLKLKDPELRLYLSDVVKELFFGESPAHPTQKLTRNI